LETSTIMSYKMKRKWSKPYRSSSKGSDSNEMKTYSKVEMKFAPLDAKGKSIQATYVQVKEALLFEIQKTFVCGARHVITSLEDEETVVLPRPRLQVSQLTDKDAKEHENDEFKIQYAEDIKDWNKERKQFEDALLKANGLIWSDYMSKSMMYKVEQHPEFASKIKGDPVELLKAIKLLMHDTIRSQYPMKTQVDTMRKLLTFRQNDLSLSEYIKQFKEIRDVFTTQNGEGIYDSYVANTKKYRDMTSSADKIKMKEDYFKAWIAMIFLSNCDWRRYGSVMDDLKESYTRNRNEYPMTLSQAIDILDNHKVDDAYKDYQKSQEKFKSKETEQEGKPETSFAQSQVKCYCCGDPAHKSPGCPLRNKVARDDWFKETGVVPKLATKSSVGAGGSDKEETDEESSVDSTPKSSKRRSEKSKSKATGWND